MSKIYASYTVSSIWDLDKICAELGITEDQIQDYDVKWNKLTLSYLQLDKDGDEEVIDVVIYPNLYDATEFDFKRPDTVIKE